MNALEDICSSNRVSKSMYINEGFRILSLEKNRIAVDRKFVEIMSEMYDLN